MPDNAHFYPQSTACSAEFVQIHATLAPPITRVIEDKAKSAGR